MIYTRPGPALISEVRRLLTAIGLNVVACGSHCVSEDFAGRLKEAKLALGFGQKLGMTAMYDRHPFASAQEKRFGIPWMWSCFVSPRATAESLRAIARRFDAKIEAKAEDVIGAHAALVEATIARYRPALEGKLVIEFSGLGADELEPLQMLGMRLGSAKGWTKKDGAWRTPRKPCAYPMPSDEGLLALLREAEPDLVIGTGWDQFEARKRGYCAWVPSRPYKQAPFGYWGFRGFADFALDVDRILNATWRSLTASKIGAVSPRPDLSE